MKQITRIPVQADSVLPQAVRLFEMLKQRGKHAALIVPDMQTARVVSKQLSLPDGCVFGASAPGARWMRGHAFETYVIAYESLCADAVHRELPEEGRFIDLLASRQAALADAHIYIFTESHGRVTTDTQRTNPMFEFELKERVKILISGEKGHVKARAEFVNAINEYQIHYRSADGRAVEGWFQETDLTGDRDPTACPGPLPA